MERATHHERVRFNGTHSMMAVPFLLRITIQRGAPEQLNCTSEECAVKML
jgi:hypothetical protein